MRQLARRSHTPRADGAGITITRDNGRFAARCPPSAHCSLQPSLRAVVATSVFPAAMSFGRYPVVVGDIQLPDAARLKTYRVRDKVLKHLDFVHLANVSKDTSGAILGVKFDSTSDVGYTYLEACMRLYVGAAQDPIFLSSGAEDYFLSARYKHYRVEVVSACALACLDVGSGRPDRRLPSAPSPAGHSRFAATLTKASL